MNGPLRQIGLVGLDTPKRTPNSSGGSGISHLLDDRGSSDADGDRSGNRSDPNSPCDSLTSLIEKTLGYRIMQVPSPPIVYNQRDNSQHQPNNGDLSDSSDSYTNFEEVLARSGLIPPDICQNYHDQSLEGHPPTAQYYHGYYDDDCVSQHQPAMVDSTLVMSGLLSDYRMHSPEFLKLLNQYQVNQKLWASISFSLSKEEDETLRENWYFSFSIAF